MNISKKRFGFLSLFSALACTALVASGVRADETLKYAFKGVPNPMYQVLVREEVGDTVVTKTGFVAYSISKVEANGQISMTFTDSFLDARGTLELNNFDLPVLPGLPAEPGAGSPSILLDANGKVIRATRMGTQTQLPGLLGPAWQLMLPQFSPDSPRRWEENVQLTTYELIEPPQPQRNSPPWGGPPWGGPPRQPQRPAERIERAVRMHNVFRVDKVEGDRVTILRTGDLVSDEMVGDQPLMKQTSDATYVFNKATGLVESFEETMTEERNQKNVTLKFPLKASARLLTKEEMAKVAEARRQAQSAAAAAAVQSRKELEQWRKESEEIRAARQTSDPEPEEAAAQVKKARECWQKTDGTPIDVLADMKGDCKRDPDGTILLTQGQRIETPKHYKVPTTIRMIIMTKVNDIRIGYCADQMIFNWEMRATEFRIDGGPASGKYKPGAGHLPAAKYVAVEFVVQKNELVIYVDGKEYYRQAADFSSINNAISITAHSESMRIKSLEVISGGK